MYVPVAPPSASPAALDLGSRITRTIEEYKQLHPELGSRDIWMAIRIAAQSTGARRVNPAVPFAIGLLMAGWIAFMLIRDKGGAGAAGATPFVAIAIISILAVFLVMLLIRRQ